MKAQDQVNWTARETGNEKKDAPLINFGGLSDGRDISTAAGTLSYGNAPSMTAGEISPPQLLSQRLAKPGGFISHGLSLGLQSNVEGQMDHMSQMLSVSGGGGGSDGDSAKRNREEENDSRSGSDNLEAISGDDLDQENSRKKKRYHRHTPQQIQELEALFKECPHPDEKQRMELSKRLCLESRQVKFWFQNRRTQMKTQIERHENSILRQENDKLRAENMAIREAMRNPVCNSCGAPAMIGEISVEEQHLRIENARLKEELDRVCALAGKFLGKSVSSISTMPSSVLELGVGNNGFGGGFTSVAPTITVLPDFMPGFSDLLGSISAPLGKNMDALLGSERSMLLELALAAMEELVAMAQMEEPLWIPSLEGGGESLNYEQYHQTFRCITGLPPVGYISEASRETGMALINSLALVETLMDASRWADMFPCIVAKVSAADVISNGVGGTRDGALQLMQAELQVLSPLVAVRQVSFLRFCKQHAEGIWAVVDVAIDGIRDNLPPAGCRRLPSGCVVQDMPNGYSKVTWVEHSEYDESQVHQIYRSLFRSGRAFGAGRWIANLCRQAESLGVFTSSVNPCDDSGTITASGRRSMLKLAQRMTKAFCAGVCETSAKGWSILESEHVGKDVRVMTRKSVNEPGEPAGVVLSAATSVWVPVPPKRLFDFLREAAFRSKWDILSNGGPMYEMDRIPRGHDAGNAVSLIRATAVNSNQSSMLILQETWIDASGAMVVYAPVDVPAMHLVMNGGDSAYVAVLPSGFAIFPDGALELHQSNGGGGGETGSLLTVGFQILVNNQPSSALTVESVETLNGLISCTLQKIKSALHCEAD